MSCSGDGQRFFLPWWARKREGELQRWAASFWYLPWTAPWLSGFLHSRGSEWAMHWTPALAHYHSSHRLIPIFRHREEHKRLRLTWSCHLYETGEKLAEFAWFSSVDQGMIALPSQHSCRHKGTCFMSTGYLRWQWTRNTKNWDWSDSTGCK